MECSSHDDLAEERWHHHPVRHHGEHPEKAAPPQPTQQTGAPVRDAYHILELSCSVCAITAICIIS
jgi:hypothetical protein